MGKLNKIVLCAMLAIAGAQSWADSTADFLPPPAPAPVPAPGPGIGVNETPGINPQANQAQAKESGASAMNMIAAVALFAACLAPKPPAIPLCVMGALAAAQSGHDAGAADMSGLTANASTKDKPVNPAFGDGNGQYTDPTVNAGMQALKDGGYTVTDTGVRNPDGTTTPASAFDSPGAMAAAGMDQKTIDMATKALGSADGSGSNPKVSSVGVSEGGGAGGGGAGGNYDANGNSYNPFRLSALQKKQMVAGKTVMFDGEPIGVKGQNLFDMVHVAYERKAQSNHFLGDNGEGLRAPASVQPASTGLKKIK